MSPTEGDPVAAENTITENVCSMGIRILTRKALTPNELLMVRFIEPDLQVQARVIYRQPMPDGQYGVGLELRDFNISFLLHCTKGR